MTEEAKPDIQAVEGVERTDERKHTKNLAQSIASKAIEATRPVGPEGRTAEERGYEPEPRAVEEGVEPVEPVDTVEETEALEDAEVVTIDLSELQELEDTAREMGVDFGVDVTELPEDLVPSYHALLTRAMSVVEQSMAKQYEALDATQRYRDFGERLTSKPERLLMTLALTHPDKFAQTVEELSEMEANPRLREATIRELEADIKLQEVTRREAIRAEAERQSKGQRLILATQRASAKLNVPYDAAEKYVAAAIERNGGNLEASQVEALVAELAGGQKPARRIKVVSAKKAQAVAKAPQTSTAAGQGPAASRAPKQPDGKNTGGGFRGMVRRIAQRLPSTD